MVVKKGETGTYVKWLQQGLHITMIIGCSSLYSSQINIFLSTSPRQYNMPFMDR